ncbi:MAG: NADH-quinone oxidoreductase subunit C [Candidatus Dormibacteria bacterium]
MATPTPAAPSPEGNQSPTEGWRAAELVARMLPADEAEVLVQNRQTTVFIPVERLLQVVQALRDDPSAAYEMPVTMTCSDWPERDLRFEVMYVLRSLVHNDLVTLAVRASEETEVPSLAGLYPGMEWHERECFDLFGLRIVGHPNLTRILLPDDWEGHPLRKDYVSFGEPVAFTHNLEWALSPQDRPEYLPGAIRGSVERS